VSGKDSTSSTTSTGSEGSTSDSDGGSEIEGNLDATDDDRSPMSRELGSGLVSLKVTVSCDLASGVWLL